MAYLGWDASLDKSSAPNVNIANVVTRALNDTMITADAATNPYCYPKLTNGADSPTTFLYNTAYTGADTAAYRASAEIAVTGSMRDLYSELVSSNGPLVKCLKQVTYAAGRTVWVSLTPIPFTNRWSLVLNY